MDLLSQRYANPCFFMNGMIQSGRFSEFVDDFCKTTKEERELQRDWEYFLHKVWKGSFAEFRKEIEDNKNNQNLSERTIETTIQHSKSILDNFNPEKGG